MVAQLVSTHFEADLDMASVLGMKIQFLPATNGYADRVWFAPSPVNVPVHIHPNHTETFTAEIGDLEVLKGGVWYRLQPGQPLIIPPGVPHSFRNHSSEPLIYQHSFSPDSRFRDLMEGYGQLGREGKLTRQRTLRTVIYVMMLFDHFRDVQVFAGPLRYLAPVLAALGRGLGFRLGIPQAR